MGKVTYTLTCDNCGGTFYSEEGFPDSHLCPMCLKVADKQKELREGLARKLRTYRLNEVEGHEDDCIVPWDECDDFTKGHWLRDADEWLTYLHSKDAMIVKQCLPGDDLTGCILVWVTPLIKEE